MASHPAQQLRRDYHGLVRRDIFPLVPHSGGTLLDVGGGIGATASALRSMGLVKRAGVIDLLPLQSAETNLDFHFSGDVEDPATLEAAFAAEGPFKVVLCLDVLEHLRDPWDLVRRLHRSLVPGGVIVASIPNMRHYSATLPLFFRGRWDLVDAGIRDRTHLRWFVRSTAVALMTSSGMKLEKIVERPSGGRKVRLFRALTLGLFDDFTNLQYLIRVRSEAPGS